MSAMLAHLAAKSIARDFLFCAGFNIELLWANHLHDPTAGYPADTQPRAPYHGVFNGRNTLKVVPLPVSLSTSILPLCASTIILL